MTKAETVAEKAKGRERLRGWLKPGDTVWTIYRHRTRSGRYVVDVMRVRRASRIS